ncbi:MarR family transcriptional regulator [Kribbella sp. NPDC056861]|uniref:MarR family transcriptional regulator n=1 Tax=Kribbella sp. NPDC056861 TaxID=3154857 RepID=UPI003445CAE1
MDAALAQYGLTAPQYAVLALLAERPGIANSELAQRSSVAPPTMIRMLGSLAEAGLIDRAQRGWWGADSQGQLDGCGAGSGSRQLLGWSSGSRICAPRRLVRLRPRCWRG